MPWGVKYNLFCPCVSLHHNYNIGATTSEDRSPLMVIPPLLPSSGSVAPPVGTVVLFPPAATTALPGPAPVIVPNMAPLTHTTSTHSPTEAQQTGDIEVPDFADDRQMFNYIVSRLQRVLKDCQPLLLVGSLYSPNSCGDFCFIKHVKFDTFKISPQSPLGHGGLPLLKLPLHQNKFERISA